MTAVPPRPVRVGESLEDLCRACKLARRHTVMAAAGGVVRVMCDTCGSQHNYRGGPPAPRPGGEPAMRAERATVGPAPEPPQRGRDGTMSEATSPAGGADLERLLRRIVREEAGLSPVAPADKWRGGTLTLTPGREGLQPKSWPLDTFFNKVVMLRNRLRVLEQQINTADVPDTLKIKLQSYITGCYGSLTSFNVLFADEDDRFKGTGGSS